MRYFLISMAFLFSLFSLSDASWSAASKPTPFKKMTPSKPKTLLGSSAPTPVKDDSGITFGFAYNARFTMQAEEQDDHSRDEYITHEFVPSLNYGNFRLRTVSDFYDHYKNPSSNEWDNTAIEGRWSWPVGDYFLIQPELRAALPLFQRKGNLNSYVGARMYFVLNTKNTMLPDLTLKYGPEFGKFNIKEEKMNTGKQDIFGQDIYKYFTDTRLRQRLYLGYNFTSKLMLMLFFQYDSNFLTDNSVQNNFYHEIFFEYAFLDNLSVDLGIANGGAVYTGDYQEIDNLKFYNRKSSEVYIGINFDI